MQFLFMTFVQNQEITMPEILGYFTELIAGYCYKCLSHTVLGPAGVNLCMSCSLLAFRECALVNSRYCASW